MKKYPLVSFCIATYKRPEFIKSTIESIFKQKYNNLEIVISEDDSERTAEEVVKSFRSKKIIYHKNKKHLGMVKSFNKAFSLSRGEFVSILTDDDPPTSDMLEIFKKILKKYPDVNAIFGGSYADITTKKIGKVTNLNLGLNSLVNKSKPYGSLEVLKPEIFFKEFLGRKLFPHYQWNAGLISREILEKIKGVPDYDSAHFIDYTYLLRISSLTNIVIVNKELAIFALHELSYGKKQDTLEEYKRGVLGFDKAISSLAIKFNSINEYQKFISDMVIMFLENRAKHYKIHEYDIDLNLLLNIYDDLSKKLTFLKKRKRELYFKLNFPIFYNFLDHARKTYGFIRIGLSSLKMKSNS